MAGRKTIKNSNFASDMKILIVEDEHSISDSIAKFLKSDGYLCEQAFTLADALMKVGSYDYDCVLLDLMLPDGDGMEVLRRVRERNQGTGVIIVSAKGSVDDRIAGIETGADDYMPKPFSLAELKVRIFALMRRRYANSEDLMRVGDVVIDMKQKQATGAGKPLNLTPTEYELLLYLACNKGKVLSKMDIAEHLTGELADMMDNFNFVFAHIKNLKHKLKAAGCTNHIRTVYATGYEWIE